MSSDNVVEWQGITKRDMPPHADRMSKVILIDQLNKAHQRIQALEDIRSNLNKAVKSSPIPWAHDVASAIRSRKET